MGGGLSPFQSLAINGKVEAWSARQHYCLPKRAEWTSVAEMAQRGNNGSQNKKISECYPRTRD